MTPAEKRVVEAAQRYAKAYIVTHEVENPSDIHNAVIRELVEATESYTSRDVHSVFEREPQGEDEVDAGDVLGFVSTLIAGLAIIYGILSWIL